jgi:hypothetical protein
MSEVLDLAGIVNRLAWLNGQVAEYRREADDLKALLRRHIGRAESVHIGRHVVTIRPTVRFSSRLAHQRLSPEELRLVCVLSADATKAKQLLAPQRYAECQQEYGEMTVRIT